VTDPESFLADVLPRLRAEAEALHEGDAAPRMAL
jgi:hypothetical protein